MDDKTSNDGKRIILTKLFEKINLENNANNRVQEIRKDLPEEICSIWLELRYGNITFADELGFDPAELDIVYEDNDTEVSQ